MNTLKGQLRMLGGGQEYPFVDFEPLGQRKCRFYEPGEGRFSRLVERFPVQGLEPPQKGQRRQGLQERSDSVDERVHQGGTHKEVRARKWTS